MNEISLDVVRGTLFDEWFVRINGVFVWSTYSEAKARRLIMNIEDGIARNEGSPKLRVVTK